ncbi:serine/threonine protein kinase [Candidatus Woesearchaeota archaeon]|nr:serine/threonine protein kinase [Candidatus Woesearchaeota archaeon]
MDNLVGQTVGGFTVESVIGKGSFNTVYRVHPQGLRRSYAMKVPNEDTPESRSRLDREVNLLDRANNEHIPQVHAQDVNGPIPYAVMEEVPDGLQDMLKNIRPDWQQKVGYAIQVLDALDHAHNTLKVVHRDIAPKNIRVNKGTVKLLDFDLSLEQKVNDIERSCAGDEGFVGTKKYASPEQQGFIDAKVSPASDVYSLGVMFYEMLTGDLPVGEMPLLSSKGLPKWLDGIDAQARAKMPEDRPTAREMADYLRKGLEGKFDGPSFMTRVRQFFGNAASCAITAAIIGGIGYGCFYGVRGCYRYVTEDDREEAAFLSELRAEDKGRIAYKDDDAKGLVYIMHAGSLDKKDSHDLGVKVDGLLWNSDGTRLFYLQDTGLVYVVHQINEYDPATGKKRTILDLSDKKKLGLGGDDITDWSMLHAADGDRILFKVCDGTWHSVLPTGSGLQADTNASVGDNQAYCPSKRHWVMSDDGAVYVRAVGQQHYLGKGLYPVWSPEK